MSRNTRAFAALVRADFLERVRRHGFLVTLAVTLWCAYVFLPPLDAKYVTLQVGGHRGLYGSAWVGTAVAMLASAFMSLFGFYLVKNSIERDRATGVGQILATTPITKWLYTTAKAASNFAVLATLTALLAVGALGMQLLRGEDVRIDVVALLAPFVVVTLPALAGVAAIAVLFESVRWLRGSLGNVIYFFLWGFLMAGTLPHRQDQFSGIGDFLGAWAVVPSILHAVAAKFPGVDPRTVPTSFGFNFSSQHRHLMTFHWAGAEWTAHVIVARLTWAALGAGVACLAAIPFDRFDAATSPARTRRRRVPGPAAVPAIEGAAPPVAVRPGATAASLPPVRRSATALPLLRGELTLMLGRLPWAAWVVPAGLFVASALTPIHVAREILLPLAWLAPLPVWSRMGARESMHRTETLLFSAPRPLARLLATTWIAGLLVAVVTCLPLLVRVLAAGDTAGAVAMFGAAAFVPTLALACGVWTGSGRLFEVLYLALWYIGPMNHLPALDFAATQPQALAAGAPQGFAIATAVLAIAAVTGRARRLQSR